MDFSYYNFDLDMKTLKFPPANTFLLQGIETCAASYLLSAAYKLSNMVWYWIYFITLSYHGLMTL